VTDYPDDLYGGTPPHEPPDTSREAAELIRDSAATLREQVYRYIGQQGDSGATDEEIQLALAMAGNTERPRRRELEEQGLVMRAGYTRMTTSKRRADVWIIVPEDDGLRAPLPWFDGPLVQPDMFAGILPADVASKSEVEYK
jgi:hypothetical protein